MSVAVKMIAWPDPDAVDRLRDMIFNSIPLGTTVTISPIDPSSVIDLDRE